MHDKAEALDGKFLPHKLDELPSCLAAGFIRITGLGLDDNCPRDHVTKSLPIGADHNKHRQDIPCNEVENFKQIAEDDLPDVRRLTCHGADGESHDFFTQCLCGENFSDRGMSGVQSDGHHPRDELLPGDRHAWPLVDELFHGDTKTPTAD